MTIRDANKKLSDLENELEYWIEEKNIAIDTAQKITSNPKGERVEGGTRTDRYKLLDKSIDDIDPEIDRLNLEINALRDYIDRNLKIIGEYEPLKAKIIKLREEHNMKWDDVAQTTHYSKRQCMRIYGEYKKVRNIKDDTPMSLPVC